MKKMKNTKNRKNSSNNISVFSSITLLPIWVIVLIQKNNFFLFLLIGIQKNVKHLETIDDHLSEITITERVHSQAQAQLTKQENSSFKKNKR